MKYIPNPKKRDSYFAYIIRSSCLEVWNTDFGVGLKINLRNSIFILLELNGWLRNLFYSLIIK